MTKPENNKEESTLFESLMKGVKPLKPSDKVVFKKKLPTAKLKRKLPETNQQAAFPLSDNLHKTIYSDDKLFYSIPNLPANTIKDLKHGKIPYSTTLDLHQKTVVEAREALGDFLQNAIHNEHRCVLIIHGRGKHDVSPPVLKNHVNSWLQQYPHILAFSSAIPQDGGTGAVYVLLKHKNKIKI